MVNSDKKQTTILGHKNADVYVEELSTGKRKIYVEVTNDDLFMPKKTYETSYPIGLIEKILNVKGPAYLCDEIWREESSGSSRNSVERILKYAFLSHLDEEKFTNKRLLDFGCGSGASTMVLARLFPHAEIVGIELDEKLLSIAQLRATHYAYNNIQFIISPNPESLPPNIGYFDHILLSAVYEHLLPNERETILTQIWSILKPGGVLFLNQTPYRYFPIEKHTTSGLPFINYLPDKIACYYARYFSKRKLKEKNWEELLRLGIRGGTVKEILSILSRNSVPPILLRPSKLGINDRIDLWYITAGEIRPEVIERLFIMSIKLLKRLTGLTIVPTLSLAIKKAE